MHSIAEFPDGGDRGSAGQAAADASERRPGSLFLSHPLRDALTNEVHARPFTALNAPERASHLAIAGGEDGAASDHATLVALCVRHGVAPPREGINHFSQDFGPFRLKWERHTEFTTYTFFRRGVFDQPFDAPVITLVPRDWLAALPPVLVAAHVALRPRGTEDGSDGSEADGATGWEPSELERLFVRESLIGSRVAGGAATVFTDWRIHSDGFSRILIHDRSLGERQAGRLVQRLLEIETYRMMALLALPLARNAAPELARMERELSDITRLIAARSGGLDEEQRLLGRLTGLAAEIERLSAGTSYRFGAARAYFALVEQRIRELREERIETYQTIGEFIDRRLVPAIRTCASTLEREEDLSRRVARAGELLRTRVDIALEGQNRDLLRSMDRRARLQLLLQQTVEGLSVAAISYYVVGLLAHLLAAAEAAHLPLDHDIVTGLSIPIVVLLVWAGMRRIHKRLTRAESGAAAADGGKPH